MCVENSNHDFVTNLMTVNTLSYIWLATQALPALQEAVGGGQVLVISSFAGGREGGRVDRRRVDRRRVVFQSATQWTVGTHSSATYHLSGCDT